MTKNVTIGILTALPEVELPELLRAFGQNPERKHDELKRGERYWHASIPDATSGELTVVISCAGLSGNSESTIPTERMIAEYSPEFMMFVGIACGIRKYALGDVVTSAAVWAYEYVKTTAAGALNRSRARSITPHIQDDIAFFNSLKDWRTHLRKNLAELDATLLPRMTLSDPTCHRSIWIASGEKVLANGELSKLNSEHDLIRAGDMEAYGFAVACEDRRPPIPWLVVRGISDYGDKTKDGDADATQPGAPPPQKDEYHHAAAQSAAAFSWTFLLRGYTVQPSYLKSAERTSSERDEAPDSQAVAAIFSSDHDPRFIDALIGRVRSARHRIVLSGMGLSFLKGNTELVSAICKALRQSVSLHVDIFYGDPDSAGIRNRTREELRESEQANRAYKKAWPREHLESIRKAFQNTVHPDDIARFSLSLTDCLPMISMIAIDSDYLWYAYGTPNVRGKDSPWILLNCPADDSPLKRFLDQNLAYYDGHKDPSLIRRPNAQGVRQ